LLTTLNVVLVLAQSLRVVLVMCFAETIKSAVQVVCALSDCCIHGTAISTIATNEHQSSNAVRRCGFDYTVHTATQCNRPDAQPTACVQARVALEASQVIGGCKDFLMFWQYVGHLGIVNLSDMIVEWASLCIFLMYEVVKYHDARAGGSV